MDFVYIGDKDQIKLYGYIFEKGEPVEVSERHLLPLGKKEKNVSVIEKLKGNSQFECVGAKGKKPKKQSPKKTAEKVEEKPEKDTSDEG